jgi:hypothetical protein
MPARRQSKKQNAEALRAGEEQLGEARRYFCSFLKFYIACGQAKCRRVRACVGDANECFPRLWPVVPENLKFGIRVAAKARAAGLSTAETEAEIKRELARWRETVAPRIAAEPASQAPSIAPASGPRIRVL